MIPRGVRLLGVVLLLGACAQSGNNNNNNNGNGGNRPPAPTVLTDPGVLPAMGTVAGIEGGPERAVGRLQGSNGTHTDLVLDELLVVTEQKAKVDALAARWKGSIVSDAPFDAVGTTSFRMYLVRIDPSGVDVSQLGAKLQSIDPLARGDHRVSSDRVTRLLAVAAQESLADPTLSIGINPLLVPAGLWEGKATEGAAAPSSKDYPYTVGSDPFTWPQMKVHRVPEAWQALQAAGKLGNRVKILILDGGFLKNPDVPVAMTMMPANGWGMMNPSTCTGGSPCPWHGTATMSTLAGVVDNGYGGAGTAGPIADLIAVPSPSPDVFQYVGYALKVIGSLLQGPRVINISATVSVPGTFGFAIKPLDNIITLLRGKTFGPVQIRIGQGALVFAAAGNEGQDVDHEDCFIGCWESDVYLPCELDDAVCVGGLKYGTRTVDPGSNFGKQQRRREKDLDSPTKQDNSVDLYAPFTVIVGPDADGSGNLQGSAGRFDSGTSFSSPFAAGIAALVWAADPSLNADEVYDILLRTADPTDDNNGLVINALDAVKAALQKGNNPPQIRITAPAEAATVYVGLPGVTLTAQVKDFEDGNACCEVAWSSDQEGDLGGGLTLTHELQTLGAQVITATVRDSQGATGQAQIHLTVKDTPPFVQILQPTGSDPIYTGRPFSILGKAIDNLADLCKAPTPANWVSWSSSNSGDGFSGTRCAQTFTPASAGSRTLTFTAQNQYGTSASASITITVQDPPPGPTVNIAYPSKGDSAQIGSTVVMGAYVSGGQAPLTYRWTWQSSNTGCTEVDMTVSVPNIIPINGPNVLANWDSSALNPAGGCDRGVGTIRLHATDALNQVGGSQPVSFTLWVPPN